MKKKFKDIFKASANLLEEKIHSFQSINSFVCNNMDTLEREFDTHYKNVMQFAPPREQNQQYKEFCEEIENISKTEVNTAQINPSQMNILGDDIEMEQQNICELIDPLTKHPVVNPVRNIICNHIYEKSAILDAIKINKRAKCPYLGCGNKQPVAQSHLRDDEELKKQIEARVILETSIMEEQNTNFDD